MATLINTFLNNFFENLVEIRRGHLVIIHPVVIYDNTARDRQSLNLNLTIYDPQSNGFSVATRALPTTLDSPADAAVGR